MTTTTAHNSGNCCTVPSTKHDDQAPGDAVDSAASCCSAPGVESDVNPTDDDTAALDEIRGDETPVDVAAIRSAGFNLLLDTGLPVTVDDLIAATELPSERVAEIFASVRARGRVEFDDAGRLIGIAGLSLTPSRHEITIAEKTRWTWCALDAVGILGALEASGTVRSTDPQTGEAIEIAFIDGKPVTDTHLFILGGYTDGNVREDWCPRVNFFGSREAADEWVTAHQLDGDIIAVSEIATDAAKMWRPVVDSDAPQVC
jgi:alkylmercury lyase